MLSQPVSKRENGGKDKDSASTYQSADSKVTEKVASAKPESDLSIHHFQ
jgi:hypothetical protein